jgi:phage terminase large subunit-like protein
VRTQPNACRSHQIQSRLDELVHETNDDWENPELWRKANPNLGISVSEEYLRQQVRRAKERPSVRNDVLMLHFNIWPRGELVSWIPPEEWEASAGVVEEEDLRGRECFVGIVATSSADIAAVAYLFPAEDEGPAAVVLDAFVPADNVARLEELHRVSYRSWLDDGSLSPTDGDVIDERAILRQIQERQEEGFAIEEIACNPRGTAALMRALDDAGFTVTSVLPSFAAMSPAMRELEKLVRGKQIAHGGNRLLAYGMRSLQARRNLDGDLKPDPEKSSGNIAGPVALLMALSRVLAKEPERNPLVRWGVAG